MSFIQRFWTIVAGFLSTNGELNVSLPPDLKFTGQTILITGATSGLGLAAAILFVQRDVAHLIITARTAAKGDIAKAEIEEKTGRKGVVSVRVLDMDSFAGVQTFVADLKKDVKAIDSVILNAGVHYFDYKLFADGWERDLQVNLLSTTLLGILLQKWMRDIKKPGQIQHLEIVGSGSHLNRDISDGKWPEKDVLQFWNRKENYISGSDHYAISKLLVQYAMREIAALAVDDNGNPSPIVNDVCPGMIKTDIARHFVGTNPFLKPIFGLVASLFMWLKTAPVEIGGMSLVLATTVSNDRHGGFERPYLSDQEYEAKAKRSVTSLEGKKMQTRVWKEILAVLTEVDPEVSKIARL